MTNRSARVLQCTRSLVGLAEVNPMPMLATDGGELRVQSNGGVWLIAWHPPTTPPAGQPYVRGPERIIIELAERIE